MYWLSALLLDLIYVTLLGICSPWLLWNALRKGKYRQGWGHKLFGSVPVRAGNRTCVWLHAVSVGEVSLLQPLMQRLAQERPDWELVVSTTTRTGYELARRKYGAERVFFCPLDFSWAVHRALTRVRPQMLILAELELWPNLIRAAARRGVQVALINGRLSEHSFRGYARLGFCMRALMSHLHVVAAQNQEYAARFLELGVPAERLHVTGSIKFDGAEIDRNNPRTRALAELAGVGSRDRVLIAGSTQAPEEALVLATYRELVGEYPDLRLIITPRHPERFDEVAALLERDGVRWQRRSRLEQTGADPRARVLLVDAVGELAAWWGLAHVAYVGGSMGKRQGQNMIEPAAYGAAVSFGPHTRNFRDIVAQLLEHEAAAVVQDGRELTAFVRRCLEQPAYAAELGRRAQHLVLRQLGATARTAGLLLADQTSRNQRRAA